MNRSKSSASIPPPDLKTLERVYRRLRRHFGHQRWWPGETPFEVMVGAILTQNTSWTQVEKAIRNLKEAGVLSPHKMNRLSHSRLAALIRPSGFFNVKAARLQHFIRFFLSRYSGKIQVMKRHPLTVLREELLAVKGIGPETADSILLYAVEKPSFVIDAYTRRVFGRHGLFQFPLEGVPKGFLRRLEAMNYHEWRDFFMKTLPGKAALFNDFHAQIVVLAKNYCKSHNPRCKSCPLKRL